jgi:cell volume regulation protein A
MTRWRCFLTVALLELVSAGRTNLEPALALAFLQQFGFGAAFGVFGGRLLVWLINRLRLHSGLYPLLAAAGGLLIFSTTQQLGGSGFLAIFLAGLVLGNSQLQAAQNILRVHDGLASLSQIAVASVYGVEIPTQHEAKTLAEYLDECSHGRVVVGPARR